MKLIHIADLHLGKRMNDISLLQDQIDVLDQITTIAKEEKVDGVLIAGDVYQKASPASEAMSAFNDFITGLAQEKIQVFIISGNHDNDQRISYFSALIKEAGIYVSERFNGTLQQIAVSDEYGDVIINLLPFVKPVHVRKCYPDEPIITYEEAIKSVLQHSTVDTQQRNVLLCHQFITGAEPSGSEEQAVEAPGHPLTVGGLDNISASLFDDFDYVALGHIHRAQRIGRDTLRYAGSPLKYSFSEANHKKSVAIVELGPKGQVQVYTRELHQPHDVREVAGFMEDLMQRPYTEDYVRVTVYDELVPPDARITLSTVFPNMMKLAVQNSKTKTDVDVLAQETIEDKSVQELFSDFYRLQNNGAEPSAQTLQVLEDILMKLEDMPYEAN